MATSIRTPRRLWAAGILAGTAAACVALLAISVSRSQEAARRTVCYGSYKGIVVGLYNYEETHGTLPAAFTTDAEERPLLSWRVTILPYIDDSRLFQEFDPANPWDVPANQQLLRFKPRLFGCPSQSGYESAFTQKAGVSGPGTVFDGTKAAILREIPDGGANTIYAGEISFPIPWTKPEDVKGQDHVSLDDPKGFSGPHDAGVPFGFCDGSGRFLSRSIDQDVLRRMFLRDNDARPGGMRESEDEE